ncbi:MAG TPA: amidase [Myxococcales bacterium]|nr:amidase [Myxococcales bacterium]
MPLPLPQYDHLDATALAELIRKGELSVRQVHEAAIARIEARNPELNAVVEHLEQRAAARLESLPEGPFRGVPFLFKDLKLMLKGTITTGSTKLMSGHVAERSSVLAERYEAAGLSVLGKTNTPEYGIMGITEPALRGPCRNPWNPLHTPGGSSGGSAAAVAARIVPAAHAGDGGGSIRIPASACGLIGLKPTRGRVTMAPFIGEAWSGYVQEHVVCRSVRDCAGLLDAVDAPTPGEPYAAPHKPATWRSSMEEPVRKLRIAFDTGALFADDCHEDCQSAVKETISLLTELGHEVVEARPTFPRDELVRAYFLAVAAGVARMVEETAMRCGVKPSFAQVEPATWLLALIGWKTPAADLVGAQWTIQRAARDVAGFFQSYDVFVNATMARPPARVGELLPSASERFQVAALRHTPLKAVLDYALNKMASGKLAATPNTQLFNQTGQPAMSLPLHWNAQGLPIGVQFAAPFGDEATLLQLATQLEQARPWANQLPNMIQSEG